MWCIFKWVQSLIHHTQSHFYSVTETITHSHWWPSYFDLLSALAIIVHVVSCPLINYNKWKILKLIFATWLVYATYLCNLGNFLKDSNHNVRVSNCLVQASKILLVIPKKISARGAEKLEGWPSWLYTPLTQCIGTVWFFNAILNYN